MADEKAQPNESLPPDSTKPAEIEMQQAQADAPAQGVRRPAPPRQPLFRK
jgi:hypothetical protein